MKFVSSFIIKPFKYTTYTCLEYQPKVKSKQVSSLNKNIKFKSLMGTLQVDYISTMVNHKASHIVLFPLPAQGHITPFLSLADLLFRLHPNLTVTLVSTARHIKSINSSLPMSSPLRLYSLPFSPTEYGLPPHAESPADVSFPQLITYFKAMESNRAAFDNFISSLATEGNDNSTSLCIISDVFLAWTVEIARKYKAAHSIFVTSGAYGFSVEVSLWTNEPHKHTDGYEFCLPDFPEIILDRSQTQKVLLAPDGSDPWAPFLKRQALCFHKTNMMLANTVEEFERVGLRMLRETFKIPIYPIGPLLGPTKLDARTDSDIQIMNWLDSHSPRSVLFISFGSQNRLQAKQMMELASGLEAAGHPFIWVVRPPLGFDVKEEFRAEWLPRGFEERMKEGNKGLIITGWAPQLMILSHKSTGAFLSHCGWNSILESLKHGVPLIGWPLMADQFYNAKMLVEVARVCVEVARGNFGNAQVDKERVKDTVQLVLGETEKGREMKKKAQEIQMVMKNAWRDEEEGSSAKGLEKFLEKVGVVGDGDSSSDSDCESLVNGVFEVTV
ncbi:hypothetical protein LUZ60_016254 [Juncus effusus]|nr:hypothetical protein LUZ60_016254 [Juncus effusus]